MGRPSLEVRHGIVDDSTLGSTIEWSDKIAGRPAPVGDLSDLWLESDPMMRGFDVVLGSVLSSMADEAVWVSYVAGRHRLLREPLWFLKSVRLPMAQHLLFQSFLGDTGGGLGLCVGQVRLVFFADLEERSGVFSIVKDASDGEVNWEALAGLLPEGSVAVSVWEHFVEIRGHRDGHDQRLAVVVETLESFGLGVELVRV